MEAKNPAKVGFFFCLEFKNGDTNHKGTTALDLNFGNMKAVAIITWISLYLITSTGLPISLHMCGDRIADISMLSFGNDSPCKCKGGKMSKGCCTTDIISLEAADHEMPCAFSIIKSIRHIIYETTWKTVYNVSETLHTWEATNSYETPPPQRKIFLVLDVFRI
jgi:hypothetical protein